MKEENDIILTEGRHYMRLQGIILPELLKFTKENKLKFTGEAKSPHHLADRAPTANPAPDSDSCITPDPATRAPTADAPTDPASAPVETLSTASVTVVVAPAQDPTHDSNCFSMLDLLAQQIAEMETFTEEARQREAERNEEVRQREAERKR